MSLSSALFSGISGLSTLGNAMTVIGDNIANVNTVGFKASRVTFQDVLSQTVATTAGTAQVGRGTSLADISCSFAQGSFESTDSTTDLAIGGAGFFVVRDPNNENNEFYTRSGEFRFDKDGNFVNPAGYIVRGWALHEDTGDDVGSITDVVLQSFTSSPQETDRITVITNLDSDATSMSSSLSNAWDGTLSTPIGSGSYEYQSTLKVYDSLGSTHDITTYYDKISGTDWEYIITCNPSEDKRSGFSGTASAGLLARGQITFSESSGKITDLTFEDLAAATGHE
ncbi:MAG: flagellar hook-basal body complex protein, partial [Desulfobacterales bacterium]|nr:flagellar hook-basal body complex protein [Desulfobacterales bacterium]